MVVQPSDQAVPAELVLEVQEARAVFTTARRVGGQGTHGRIPAGSAEDHQSGRNDLTRMVQGKKQIQTHSTIALGSGEC